MAKQGREGGIRIVTSPDGVIRSETFTCYHCPQIVDVDHRPTLKGIGWRTNIDQVGDVCRGCMRLICARCAALRICTPNLKQIEAQEEAALHRPGESLPALLQQLKC